MMYKVEDFKILFNNFSCIFWYTSCIKLNIILKEFYVIQQNKNLLHYIAANFWYKVFTEMKH